MDEKERDERIAEPVETEGTAEPPVPNAICPLCREEICIDPDKGTVICPCCGKPIIVVEAMFQFEMKDRDYSSAAPDLNAADLELRHSEGAADEPTEEEAAAEQIHRAMDAAPVAPVVAPGDETEEENEPNTAEQTVGMKKKRMGALAAAGVVALGLLFTVGNASQEKEMTVTVEAVCEDYNHVGNDWTMEYSFNGEEILSGDKVKLHKGDKIVCESVVTENDASSPDSNSASSVYTVTADDLKNGFSLSHENIVITEDHGRYTGNSCTWEIVFHFDK